MSVEFDEAFGTHLSQGQLTYVALCQYCSGPLADADVGNTCAGCMEIIESAEQRLGLEYASEHRDWGDNACWDAEQD